MLAEVLARPSAFVNNRHIGFDGVKAFGAAEQEMPAALRGFLDDRIAVMFDQKGRLVAFHNVLIEPKPLVQKPQRRLKTASNGIGLVRVQTFVVPAVNTQHRDEVAGLGGENSLCHGALDTHERVKSAGLPVVLENPRQARHAASFSSAFVRFAGSY